MRRPTLLVVGSFNPAAADVTSGIGVRSFDGRWYLAPSQRWLSIPGEEWARTWVPCRHGDGYIASPSKPGIDQER